MNWVLSGAFVTSEFTSMSSCHLKSVLLRQSLSNGSRGPLWHASCLGRSSPLTVPARTSAKVGTSDWRLLKLPSIPRTHVFTLQGQCLTQRRSPAAISCCPAESLSEFSRVHTGILERRVARLLFPSETPDRRRALFRPFCRSISA